AEPVSGWTAGAKSRREVRPTPDAMPRWSQEIADADRKEESLNPASEAKQVALSRLRALLVGASQTWLSAFLVSKAEMPKDDVTKHGSQHDFCGGKGKHEEVTHRSPLGHYHQL